MGMIFVWLARLLFFACAFGQYPDQERPGGKKNVVIAGSRTGDHSEETSLDTSPKGLRIKRQQENKEKHNVDCVGPQPDLPDPLVPNAVTRYCPAGDKEGQWDSGNFASVKGVGTRQLTIDAVDTDTCKRDKPWSDKCSCKGLVSGLLMQYSTASTEIIDFTLGAVGEAALAARRCYLGRAKEVAEFNFVHIPGCKGLKTPHPIATDEKTYVQTC